jgi:metal-responsive CopG/Arc/MetJ family transcriptional regulator|tara:strand:- start:36 stop:236 length:201 start_codon:yes stop_codon:yes gene_type:complete
MRDELFDLNIQDAEDIMNGFDRLVESRRESNREQVRRDALNYYLKQGNTIEDAMYMAGYKSPATLN